MTTLRPSSSRGSRRMPVWAFVVAAVLLGALLIGAGLLLTNVNDDDAAKPTATATCTPTPGPATTPPAVVKVNVYNSTARAGLARDTADSLQQRGFTIDDVANDPKKAKIAGTAVVRYVAGAGTQARWVAAQIADATLLKVSATGRASTKVDLVIGAGYTALATPDEAKAAFAASAPRSGC